MAAIGKCVVGIIIGAYYSFVAWKLWLWFLPPLGFPSISYAQGFGLYALAASVMLWGVTVNEEDADKSIIIGLAKALVASIILFEGWVAHIAIGLGA